MISEHPVHDGGAGVVDAEQEHGVHPRNNDARSRGLAAADAPGTRPAQAPAKPRTYVHNHAGPVRAGGRRADGRARTCPPTGKTDRIRAAAERRASLARSRWPRSSWSALPGAARAQAATNSAHEITFWADFDQVATLSDAQLDGFADMGVGAFVMSTGYLIAAEWTDDPTPS